MVYWIVRFFYWATILKMLVQFVYGSVTECFIMFDIDMIGFKKCKMWFHQHIL